MILRYVLPLGLVLVPVIAEAQTFSSIVYQILRLFNPIAFIIFSATVAIFFFGLVKFIYNAGDSAAIEEGRRLMIWGIIGIAVMVSVWGLVMILQNTFFGGGGGGGYLPTTISV